MPKSPNDLWQKRYSIDRYDLIHVLQGSEDAALRRAGAFYFQYALEVENKAYQRRWGKVGQRMIEAYRRFFQTLSDAELEQIVHAGFSHELNDRLNQYMTDALEAL